MRNLFFIALSAKQDINTRDKSHGAMSRDVGVRRLKRTFAEGDHDGATGVKTEEGMLAAGSLKGYGSIMSVVSTDSTPQPTTQKITQLSLLISKKNCPRKETHVSENEPRTDLYQDLHRYVSPAPPSLLHPGAITKERGREGGGYLLSTRFRIPKSNHLPQLVYKLLHSYKISIVPIQQLISNWSCVLLTSRIKINNGRSKKR